MNATDGDSPLTRIPAACWTQLAMHNDDIIHVTMWLDDAGTVHADAVYEYDREWSQRWTWDDAWVYSNQVHVPPLDEASAIDSSIFTRIAASPLEFAAVDVIGGARGNASVHTVFDHDPYTEHSWTAKPGLNVWELHGVGERVVL